VELRHCWNHGADVDGKSDMLTPLQVCALQSDTSLLELFLEFGANPELSGNPTGEIIGRWEVDQKFVILALLEIIEELLRSGEAKIQVRGARRPRQRFKRAREILRRHTGIAKDSEKERQSSDSNNPLTLIQNMIRIVNMIGANMIGTKTVRTKQSFQRDETNI
jgi:hypothetical protein